MSPARGRVSGRRRGRLPRGSPSRRSVPDLGQYFPRIGGPDRDGLVFAARHFRAAGLDDLVVGATVIPLRQPAGDLNRVKLTAMLAESLACVGCGSGVSASSGGTLCGVSSTVIVSWPASARFCDAGGAAPAIGLSALSNRGPRHALAAIGRSSAHDGRCVSSARNSCSLPKPTGTSQTSSSWTCSMIG